MHRQIYSVNVYLQLDDIPLLVWMGHRCWLVDSEDVDY
jgi:hypothetical protein